MNHYIHDYYFEAGRIAAIVRTETVSRIKEDIPLLEIAEFVEERIKDLGANPAFPCNISINEIASHYTPQDYLRCFRKGDVVKLDLGAHIEGFIADTATTLEIGTDHHSKLIRTCEEALDKAIGSLK